MKYIISESKLESLGIKFLDEYLKNYPVRENDRGLVLWGQGENNKLAYEKEDRILFVAEDLFQLLRDMFSITNTPAKKIFVNFMKTKGYEVKRFI